MESEQTNTNKYIAQAVVEAARAGDQTMPIAGTARIKMWDPE